jgi:hypothetical protein
LEIKPEVSTPKPIAQSLPVEDVSEGRTEGDHAHVVQSSSKTAVRPRVISGLTNGQVAALFESRRAPTRTAAHAPVRKSASRTAPISAIVSQTVIVGVLQPGCTRDNVVEAMSSFGAITGVRVVAHRSAGSAVQTYGRDIPVLHSVC